MRHTFERYKSVAEEALKMFCRYDMNTRADISTVLKMLMLYPYQISDGSYIYKFENYKTFEEAANAYCIAKENAIKDIADEYKNIIPTKLYDALNNYKVDITLDKNYVA